MVLDPQDGLLVRLCDACHAECASAAGAACAVAPERSGGADEASGPPARDWTAALVAARSKHAAQARLDIADTLHQWTRVSAVVAMRTPLPAAVAARAARAAAERGGVRWEEDSSRTDCPLCSTAFSALRRRHHCRLCGTLCCSPCSSKLAAAPAAAPPPGAAGGGAGGASAALAAAASASAAAAGLPAPAVRACTRCAAHLRRHAVAVELADALARTHENAVARAYARLAAARGALAEQMGLYARLSERLELALDPTALRAELAAREATIVGLLPRAMQALKLLADARAEGASEARAQAAAKAMAVRYLQDVAPRFHGLKRAAELRLAAADAAAIAAAAARAAAAAADGGARGAVGGRARSASPVGSAAALDGVTRAGRLLAFGDGLSRVGSTVLRTAAGGAVAASRGGVSAAASGVTAAVAALAGGGGALPPSGARPTGASAGHGGHGGGHGGSGQRPPTGAGRSDSAQRQQAQGSGSAGAGALPTAEQLDLLTHALVLVSRLSLLHVDAAERVGAGGALHDASQVLHAQILKHAQARGEAPRERDAAITRDLDVALARPGPARDLGLAAHVTGATGGGGGGGGDGDTVAALSEMVLVVGEACALIETQLPAEAAACSTAALRALRQQLKASLDEISIALSS
jgi:hypothetical protein